VCLNVCVAIQTSCRCRPPSVERTAVLPSGGGRVWQGRGRLLHPSSLLTEPCDCVLLSCSFISFPSMYVHSVCVCVCVGSRERACMKGGSVVTLRNPQPTCLDRLHYVCVNCRSTVLPVASRPVILCGGMNAARHVCAFVAFGTRSEFRADLQAGRQADSLGSLRVFFDVSISSLVFLLSPLDGHLFVCCVCPSVCFPFVLYITVCL